MLNSKTSVDILSSKNLKLSLSEKCLINGNVWYIKAVIFSEFNSEGGVECLDEKMDHILYCSTEIFQDKLFSNESLSLVYLLYEFQKDHCK